MGSEVEVETETKAVSRLELPVNKNASSGRFYFQESPFYISPSVPFGWEEQPGKPRECSSSISAAKDLSQQASCLVLPPRLMLLDTAKHESPTTVIKGPYITCKPRSYSFSFRITRGDSSYGSFRKKNSTFSDGFVRSETREKGLLSSFRSERRSKRVVIDNDMEQAGYDWYDGENLSSTPTSGASTYSNFFDDSKTPFWATVCNGLKRVLPRRWRRPKRDGSF